MFGLFGKKKGGDGSRGPGRSPAPHQGRGRDWAEQAAVGLTNARQMGFTIEGFPEGLAPENEDEAYLLQSVVFNNLDAAIVGWKIGCTSARAQEILGISSPFFGPLREDAIYNDVPWLPRSDVRRIGVEGEIAFVLGADLPAKDTPYTTEEVERAIDKFCPAIELISPSFKDFETVGALANIADLGATDGLVLQEANDYVPKLDLRDLKLTMNVNKSPAGEGVGGDVLGDPVQALTWLANELSRRNLPLTEGMIVSTGTCTGLVWLEPGQQVDLVTDLGDAMMLYGDEDDFDLDEDGRVSPKTDRSTIRPVGERLDAAEDDRPDFMTEAEAQAAERSPDEPLVYTNEEGVPVIDASHMKPDDDDWEPPEYTPPSTERILRRALCLAAVGRRFGAEQMEKVPAFHETFLPWLKREGLDDELEDWEREAIRAKAGALDDFAENQASWMPICSHVLAWALGLTDLPPPHKGFSIDEMYEPLGFSTGNRVSVSVDDLLAKCQRRSEEELAQANDLYLAVHWRIRQYSMEPEPLDFVGLAKTMEWLNVDVSGPWIVDGDFAWEGTPVDKLDEGDFGMAFAFADFRHKASNWLMGHDEIFSEVDTST